MILKYYTRNPVTDFLKSTDALFHYTKKSSAFEHILLEKRLKYGAFINTNDPQEYNSKLISSTGYGWSEESMIKILKSGNIIDNIIRNEIGFLSFCQNISKDNYIEDGFLKSRMWSQYGENHEGLCLVFSREKITSKIKELTENKIIDIFCENIEYGDDFEDHTVVDLDEEECKGLTVNDIAYRTIINYRRALFFRKQNDYKDEQEYRVIRILRNSLIENDEYNTIDISDSIKCIILGDRFNKVYIPTIKYLVQENDIPIKQLHWNKNQFFLLDVLA